MAIVRLPHDAGLWIWSPVALTDDVRTAVNALGSVRYLIAPNGLHHTFLAVWADAFPDAQVHAAPGLSGDVADTAIHATLGDQADTAWAGTLEQVVVRGNRITTEVVFFHRPSATVLVTDLVQQIPKGWYHGWRAVVARLDLMTAPAPSVPRKFRMAFRDRRGAQQSIGRILAWPADRLVVAHGAPVTDGGAEVLREAFRWLIR
jgi:hypothetical protein